MKLEHSVYTQLPVLIESQCTRRTRPTGSFGQVYANQLSHSLVKLFHKRLVISDNQDSGWPSGYFVTGSPTRAGESFIFLVFC